MLTQEQTEILEQSWEIFDKLRNCKGFNESHDLTIGDACQIISDFLDWLYLQERSDHPQIRQTINLSTLESFQNF
jgi:hypothetical protein